MTIPGSSTCTTDRTIFYAWQSDTDSKLNRTFIRDATRKAVEALAADTHVQEAVRLDHDTKGVSGTPDIAQVIFEKIEGCTVFLADLTFIGQSHPDSPNEPAKRIPNPNVLIELGWAMRSVRWNRVVCVMNTAYGTPDHLPFDLRGRRHPICYHLASWDAADKLAVKQKLVEDLKIAIQAVLNETPSSEEAVAKAKHEQEIMWERIKTAQAGFEDAVLRGQFHGFTAERGVLTLSFMPIQPLDELLDFTDDKTRHTNLRAICGAIKPPEFHGRALGVTEQVGYEDPPCGAAELRQDGSVFLADGRLLCGGNVPPHLEEKYGDKLIGAVPPQECESHVVATSMFYLELMRNLGVGGPIAIQMAMFRIQGFFMGVRTTATRRGQGFRIFDKPELRPDVVTVDEEAEVSNSGVMASLLKPTFDYMWREFGFPGSPHFNEAGQ